jgi:2-octaprenyl-6-methoxyphenol hydroxylase
MTEQRFAVAWTLPPEEAEELGAIDEAAFIERLQAAFGYRAGIFTRCGPRRVYPLDLSTVLEPVRHRACVVGNAAHIVHPVAGQGFNLGLRDVAELAETLAVAHARGEDPGQVAVLRRYARRRRIQTRLVSGFTDSLVTLFSHRSRAVVASRSAGLLAVGLMPPLKRFLLRRTMGLRGRAPWLATGLGLDLMPLDERDESR